MGSTSTVALDRHLARYCESFNGKLRDECLSGELFYSLKEAIVVIEQWRKQCKNEFHANSEVDPGRGTRDRRS